MPLFVALPLLLAAVRSFANEPSTRPVDSSAAVPDSVTVSVLPENEDVKESGDPKQKNNEQDKRYERVILLKPPKSFETWLSEKLGKPSEEVIKLIGPEISSPLDRRIKLYLWMGRGCVSGAGSFYVGPWGWELRTMETADERRNDSYHVVGSIEVNIRPDRRCIIPFDCIVQYRKNDDPDGFGSDVPTGATITWSKPQEWQRKE